MSPGQRHEPTMNLETGDLSIGAVELKDAGTTARAIINAADTARTTASTVLLVQHVDAAGNVLNIGTAAMAASTPVTIATDDTLINVTKGVAIAGSGQLLNCVAAATDYTLVVVASAVYRVTAVNGIIYMGIADVQAADSAVLWTVPVSDTQIITIPSGTALHYRSDAAGVTGRLARIQ